MNLVEGVEVVSFGKVNFGKRLSQDETLDAVDGRVLVAATDREDAGRTARAFLVQNGYHVVKIVDTKKVRNRDEFRVTATIVDGDEYRAISDRRHAEYRLERMVETTKKAASQYQREMDKLRKAINHGPYAVQSALEWGDAVAYATEYAEILMGAWSFIGTVRQDGSRFTMEDAFEHMKTACEKRLVENYWSDASTSAFHNATAHMARKATADFVRDSRLWW